MRQDELDAAVSVATGESIGTIVDRGFVILTHGPVEREPCRPPLMIDWDELDYERRIAVGRA